VNAKAGDGQSADVQMPFTSHLEELRSRLIKSVLAIAVAFLGCYAVVDEIFAVLAAPLRRLHMKVAFAAAILVALPVLLWQAWQFVAPGLYEHEKRYTRSFVSFGSVFFIAGVAFCYEVVIELGLNFLLRRYEVIHVQPLIQIGDYLSLVSRLVLAFGVMFELPVLAFFFTRVGLIDHRFLIRHIGYAVIAIALVAAILTPPDLIAQVLFMVPLSLLYVVSIGVAYMARKKSAASVTDD
jgi:sec-independent protein translocase protein TatC